jgi:quercetin dioxygenase-like cupin family protein
MSANAIIRRPNDTTGVTLAGQPMAFLVTGKHTKYTSMFDWMIPARFSTGRHVHDVQEETFYVVEGECEWQIGEEIIEAVPGTFVFIPPGVPHNIANATDKPARVIMTVSPPGHERYFEQLAEMVSRSGPPDSQAIAELRRRYDTEQISALQTRK